MWGHLLQEFYVNLKKKINARKSKENDQFSFLTFLDQQVTPYPFNHSLIEIICFQLASKIVHALHFPSSLLATNFSSMSSCFVLRFLFFVLVSSSFSTLQPPTSMGKWLRPWSSSQLFHLVQFHLCKCLKVPKFVFLVLISLKL